MENKKVFISYSWSSPKHEEWVLELVHRLIGDGIDVVFDRYDLKEGHDKYAFMEKAVHAKDIDKVLVILDPKYKEKADERTGGVGTETLIISPNVYQSTEQEKFIPVIAELDENGNPPLPTYMSGKIYIDLSGENMFGAEYEKLIRNIYQRPSLSKPMLGNPPSYIFEETAMNYKTSALVRTLPSQLERAPLRINSLIKDFTEEFLLNLENFAITESSRVILELGEQVLNNLNQTFQLKEDLLAFFDIIFKADYPYDFERITSFLEKLLKLLQQKEDVEPQISSFENYKFLIREIFVSVVALALKREKYSLLTEILHIRYFVPDRYGSEIQPKTFEIFDTRMQYFDQYYNQLAGTNFFSPQADLMVKRTGILKKQEISNGDLLCFYVAQLNNWHWFPYTYIYRDEYSRDFFFLNKLVSKRHFNKIKELLGFENAEDLKEQIKILGDGAVKIRGYSQAFFSEIPGILKFVNLDDIATTL